MLGWFIAVAFVLFALVVVYSCLVVSGDDFCEWEDIDDEDT